MLPQITLIDCISSGKFKVPIITNTTPLNMLENNIDISKAPLIRLIFFILRLFSSYNSNYLLLLFLCNMTIATISIMIIIGICLCLFEYGILVLWKKSTFFEKDKPKYVRTNKAKSHKKKKWKKGRKGKDKRK